MDQEDLCPVTAKRSNDADNQPRTVAEANLALLNSKRMCDVTFVFGINPVNRVQIQAHQFCLRSRSLVFDLMFKAGKMGEMTEIEITDANPDAFQVFLEFIYGDKFDVSMVTAFDILYLAEKYRVQPLIEKCEDLLKEKIQIQDAIKVFEAAGRYGLSALREKAGVLLTRNIEVVLKEPYFLEATEDTLIELLRRSDLVVDEIELFQSAIKWGLYHIKDDSTDEGLKTVLAKILPHIRFPVMTTEQFATIVIPTKLLPMDQVVDICSYLAIPKEKRNEGNGNLSTVPRIPISKSVSFYVSMSSPCEIETSEENPYVETVSFSVEVQETHTFSTPNTRKPLITGVNLYLPQCSTKTEGMLEFVLHIVQFEDDDGSVDIVAKRHMFVQSCLAGERVEVSVVPPLELVNGHNYEILLKDDTCHPSGEEATYSWSEQCGSRTDSAKLQGRTSSIEFNNFEFPEEIAHCERSGHVDDLQAITGVSVVVL